MRVVLLTLASMGFGAALTLVLTKPPVFLAVLLKIISVIK